MSGPLPSWSGGLTSSSMLACLLACVALNDKKSERQASQRFGWGCLMLRARGNNKQNKKGKTGAMYGLYDFWFAFSTQGGRVRVVKELDLKSNGPCPRRFKSCRPRLTLLFFFPLANGNHALQHLPLSRPRPRPLSFFLVNTVFG